MTLSPLAKAPVIDGQISAGEWDGAGGTVNFMDWTTGFMDLRVGTSKVGFTKDRLYILCVSETPPTGPLAKTTANDTDDVVMEDSIELWLDPNRENRQSGAGDLRYYQAIFGPSGGVYDLSFNPKGTPNRGWNGDWEHACHIDRKTGTMVMEISLPFADLGWPAGQSPIGKTIGVLIARNYKFPWSQATWFPINGQSFDKPLAYAAAHLTADAPVVSIDALGNDFSKGRVDFHAKVFNPTAARDVKVALKVTSSDMPGFDEEKTIHLPANGSAEFVRADDGFHADAEHKLKFVVTEVGGGAQTLFDYSTQWTKATRLDHDYPEKWQVQAQARPEDAFLVAFYPSLNLARVQFDPAKLFKTPDEAKVVTHADVTIVGPDGKQLAAKTITLSGTVAEETFHVTAIPDGIYSSSAKFETIDQPITKTWTRKHFPWEGNTLGISKEIHKPFESLRVEGDRVTVVQREYSADGLGLWKSVKSVSKDVLASPIVLKVDDHPISGGEGNFTASDSQSTTFEGKAQAPGVQVVSRCTTELDGVMKVELTLAPGAEAKPIQSLTLDIPLLEKRAPLFHVSTTGLRSNPAGALPAGTGEVWNSASFPDGNWIGNFKPYVWVGDGERGIAFFADNDAGWELKLVDEKNQVYAPCESILRENGVVTIRVNLIQKPTTLTKPRKIVFGLMATPGKPMMANWRRTLLNNGLDGCDRVMFMGSQYWGSDQHCSAKYPRNGDLSALDAIRKARLHQPLDIDAFIKDWASRNFGPNMAESKTKEMMTSLLGVTLRWAYDTPPPARYTVYFDEFHSTSPLHAEVPIFGSEWSGVFGYGQIGGLVRSHQDFACYYGAEFVKRGVGLYFDNAFPKRGMDPLTTNAYRLPDGRIQPSAGIWAHRDYLRRIWNIHRELSPADMPTFMLVHVTNAEIAPYTVWNDANLDLEWMYGPEPKQAIFSPELLRAESTGLLSGNSPYVLARVSNTTSKEQEIAVFRTRFGAMMVHEIKPEAMAENELALFKKMFDFGYGKDDCQVYRYWDDEYPLKISDDRVKTLLLRRGNELMILACSWNPQPTNVTVDATRVGLGDAHRRAEDVEGNKSTLQFDATKQTLSFDIDGYGVRLLRLSPEP